MVLVVMLFLCLTTVVCQYPNLYYYTSPRFTTKAVAILRANGTREIVGSVSFEQPVHFGSVIVQGIVHGLSTGEHGFHIHQLGDLSNGCISAGPHFNPSSFTHGAQGDIVRHVGDLGNVRANSSGIAAVSLLDDRVRLNGKDTIIGRSVIVHALRDDLGKGGNEESLISGNAGARIACGVIGVMSEEPR